MQYELYPVDEPVVINLSPRMLKTLKKCWQIELEFPGKPYGPRDLKESFIGLYKRGLLDIDISNKKLKTARWYITKKGLQYLVLISTRKIQMNDPTLFNNINRLQQNLEALRNSIHNLKVTSGRINNCQV